MLCLSLALYKMKITLAYWLTVMVATAHLGLPLFQHWCNTRMEKHVHILPLSCQSYPSPAPAEGTSCCSAKTTSTCDFPVSGHDQPCCDESITWLADNSDRIIVEAPASTYMPIDHAVLFRGYPYSLRQHFLFRDLEIYFLRPPPPFKHTRSYLSIYLC